MPQVLLQRRIVLANVPVGSARVHFSESDFGTFLTHPLMRSKAVVAGHVFRFLPRGIAFREASGGAPLVVFRGVWGGDQMAYTAELQPSGTGSMRCQVLPSEGGESPHCGALGGGLARFFEGLMIDLQGAELRFRSMDVERLPGGPVLNLQLSLRVREFPPLDVKF